MLRNIKALAKDTVVYGLSSVLAQLIGIILVPFYTKELAPEEYGLTSLVILVVNFLTPIAGLGLESALFRYFAMSSDQLDKTKYFTSASLVKLFSVILLGLVLMPLYPVLNSCVFEGALAPRYFYILLGLFFLNNISSLSFVVLRADRKVIRISVLNIITLVVSLSVSIYLVLILKLGVIGVLYASLIASGVKAVLFSTAGSKYFRFSDFNLETLKTLLSYGVPRIPHKIQGMVISLFTLFIINQKMGLVIAGMYVVARKLSKPLQFLVSMIQQAWAPYKFQIFKEEKDPAKVFSAMVPLYWIFLLVVWTIGSLVAPYIFELLIDEQYWSAIPYIPFLLFIAVSEGFRFTVNTGFELSKKQIYASLATFVGMVIMIGVSLSTLNFYAPYGFFIGQILANFATGFILWWRSNKLIHIPYPIAEVVLLLLISLSAIIASTLSGHQVWPDVLIALSYLGISLLLVLRIPGYKAGILKRIPFRRMSQT